MATTVYAATRDGIYTILGADGAWQIASHGLKGWEVCSVLTSAARPREALAATRGDGVWLTTDSGASWSKPSYGRFGPAKVQCLSRDPKAADRIVAGCEPIDLFISEDLGRTWERQASLRDLPFVESIRYPVPSVEPHVRDIRFDARDSDKMYVALQVGYMVRTEDGGKSWDLIDDGVDADIHTIVADPASFERVTVATGGHDCRAGVAPGRALYNSLDGGQHWTPVAMQFSQEYSVPLVAHAARPAVMVTCLAHGVPPWTGRPNGAEAVMIRSKDAGHTWHELNTSGTLLGQFFAMGLTFDETDPNGIYAGLWSGQLIRSTDGGDSWQTLDVRLPGAITDLKCVTG